MRTPGRPMRNPQAEATTQRHRALVAFLLVFALLAVLAARFAWLQVFSYEEFHTRSEANRIKARPIVPARGLIYDRAGRILADNVPAYRLDVVREDADDLETMVVRLREVIDLSDEEARAFLAASRARRSFQPVTVKLRLSDIEVARFAVNRHRFPGVEVVPYLNRHYPHGDLFAHVVGYVGRIDTADLKRVDPARYSGATHIGRTGIERQYESRLHGQVGVEQVEVNAEGRTLRVVGRDAAHAGQDLHLSIDAELQQAVVDAFEGQPGAAVVLDPRNGEVLALASLPSYDPNPFVSGIGQAAYAALLDSPSRPLFNRVLQGGYEPGSTLKPFVGLAGLEYGLRTPRDTTLSTGAFRLPGQEREYRDWRRGGHGAVNLHEAMAQSVNTYFFQLAVDMGIERLGAYLGQFGFGEATGIDLLGEASGVLPSPRWKRAQRNLPWYPGETVIAGIGQGFWVVTPLQLAHGVATLAARGMPQQPHLLYATQDGFGDAPVRHVLSAPGEPLFRNPANWEAVRDGMIAVVNGPTGTARTVGIGFPYTIAGKTGTAERYSRTTEAWEHISQVAIERHQVLFEAFTPAEDARIAVIVALEAGRAGGRDAAPIARTMLDAWLLAEGGPTPAPAPVAGAAP